jgi:hypothetical protein
MAIVEVTWVKACLTCRHWGRPDEREEGKQFRECQKIPHAESGTDVWWEPGDEVHVPSDRQDRDSVLESPAVTVDGSGYFAALRTQATFHCSLYEPPATVTEQT